MNNKQESNTLGAQLHYIRIQAIIILYSEEEEEEEKRRMKSEKEGSRCFDIEIEYGRNRIWGVVDTP